MMMAGEVKIQAPQSSRQHHGNWGLASLTFFGESIGKNFSPHDVSSPSYGSPEKSCSPVPSCSPELGDFCIMYTVSQVPPPA